MSKRVLVAPLDWGLGHATRCIPVIKELIQQNFQVILGVTPITDKILRGEFPELEAIDLNPYEIQYAKHFPVWWTILTNYGKLKKINKKEKKEINAVVKKHKIDIIISDNRYGCFSSKTKNILITHQLKIKSPLFEGYANKILKKELFSFDEIWVPDNQDKKYNLSGELSHTSFENFNLKYIGAMSALSTQNNETEKRFEICFLISGPEPKRANLENKCIEFINNSSRNFAIIRGTEKKITVPVKNKNCVVIDFAGRNELQSLLSASKTIVCRSGYSTIMDLAIQKIPALIIPTPGQTEQEYLANYLDGKFNFKKIKSLNEIINSGRDLKSEKSDFININQLKEAISAL